MSENCIASPVFVSCTVPQFMQSSNYREETFTCTHLQRVPNVKDCTASSRQKSQNVNGRRRHFFTLFLLSYFSLNSHVLGFVRTR